MFSIPSWSKAGEEYCTVNKALWVRILDSNMLTSTLRRAAKNIVSQYIAFIGLYWRRNHAAVFFHPPLQPLVLPHFDGDHGVTSFSIDRIVLGKIPCCPFDNICNDGFTL